MTGAKGMDMASGCDLAICVPSECTAHIQEAHITVGHIICGLVETEYFGRNKKL
jgi:D-sedoheptulose 7-phosphate isomerase